MSHLSEAPGAADLRRPVDDVPILVLGQPDETCAHELTRG